MKRETVLKGDNMSIKDSFNNGMRKCNFAAEFAKRGIDIKMVDNMIDNMKAERK